jgi:tRNA (cmo5U34)-methyltransferase
MNKFDESANDWDKNNVHTERSKVIAVKLKEKMDFKPGMKVMEFGAGTGLLSFFLRDSFASITLVDSSREMIRVCNEKISQGKATNMNAVQIDLEHEDFNEKFNLIYSQMVFHHIGDVGKMIHKFSGMLEENGKIAIADLFTEDGTFHSDGFTGHHGFDPEELSYLIHSAGFTDIHFETCFIQEKIDSEGKRKEYPVFLITARKS